MTQKIQNCCVQTILVLWNWYNIIRWSSRIKRQSRTVFCTKATFRACFTENVKHLHKKKRIFQQILGLTINFAIEVFGAGKRYHENFLAIRWNIPLGRLDVSSSFNISKACRGKRKFHSKNQSISFSLYYSTSQLQSLRRSGLSSLVFPCTVQLKTVHEKKVFSFMSSQHSRQQNMRISFSTVSRHFINILGFSPNHAISSDFLQKKLRH